MQSVDPKPEPELEQHVPGPAYPFRSPRDSRKERAGAGLDRFRNRFTLAMVFVVLPLLMTPALIVMAPLVSGSWNATHGRGVHGTFTSYDRSCDDGGVTVVPWPGSCTLTGIFDPADGSFPLDATMEVSSSVQQVSAGAVVATGSHPADGTSVYVVGSRGWLEPATLELTALAALVTCGVLVVRAWRERRRHRQLLATPGYVDGGRHRRPAV